MARRSLALAAPGVRVDLVSAEFLDRIGGCREPMSESFSYEISPYIPKPYGKVQAE